MKENKRAKRIVSLDTFFTEQLKEHLEKPSKQNEKPNHLVDYSSFSRSIADLDSLKQITENIIDIPEALKVFLRNIKLPEIQSPSMPRIKLEDIAKPGAKILVVTEKPKVALALAKTLSRNYKALNYGRKIKYFALNYRDYHITIVPLKGHLIEYDTHQKYKSWFAVDPIEIIKNEKSLTKKIRYPELAKLLRQLARKHDILIIATDADEEGENIGWEATQIIYTEKKLPTYRMWFLSIQPEELKKAFHNLTLPLKSWALAPEARKLIDAFSGFAATRELTIAGRTSSGLINAILGKGILSLGRVQSPTLYLLYLREKYIRNFKPKPYWTLSAIAIINGKQIQFQHIDSPFYDKNLAQNLFRKVSNAREGRLIDILRSTEKKRPEPPLNTNKALIMINKILKIPASKAMKILEDLYLDGLITYPRTDTDKYPPNYDHKKNLLKLRNHPELGVYASKALSFGARLTRNGSKLIGDHLPITPIDIPRKSLPSAHQKVYELIVRRYLALFYPPAEIEKQKIIIDINQEKFVTNLTRIKELGFWVVYPYTKPSDTYVEIPPVIAIKEIKLIENKTKPPTRLNEAELLKLMEKLGLGTKATRPEHIQKLIDRKYVIRKGNRLYLTELGYRISEFLEKIWPEFLQPYFSAYVLSLLRRIMNKELTLEAAVKEARSKFLELFLRLRKSRDALKNALSSIDDATLISSSRRKTAKRKTKKRRKKK